MSQATTTPSVTVFYFAQFREEAGGSRESISLPTDRQVTAGMLFDEIAAKHGFTLGRPSVRPAINGAYAQWDDRVNPDDELVFIPPVAGG